MMDELGLQALHRRMAGIDVHRMLHLVTVLIEQKARPDPSLVTLTRVTPHSRGSGTVMLSS